MSGLSYHWSNPRFAGLPWACDAKKVVRRRCVKRNFSLPDVRNETARLSKESPGACWSFKFCLICQGFHVLRH